VSSESPGFTRKQQRAGAGTAQRVECRVAWKAAVTASWLLLRKRSVPRVADARRFLLAAARRAAIPSARREKSLLKPG
jgi:hypothetical protein